MAGTQANRGGARQRAKWMKGEQDSPVFSTGEEAIEAPDRTPYCHSLITKRFAGDPYTYATGSIEHVEQHLVGNCGVANPTRQEF